MAEFLLSFLTASLIMSLIILGMLVFIVLMPKKFSPRLRYMAWTVVLLGLVIPVRPIFGNGLISVGLTYAGNPSNRQQTESFEGMVNEPQAMLGFTQDFTAQGTNIQTIIHTEQAMSPFIILAFVWAIAALAIFVYHIWKYIGFTRIIRRWGIAVHDDLALSVFRNILEEKGIKEGKVGLKKCRFISTSMLVGFFRPVVLLPDKKYDADELELILRHELIHYKRGDIFIKLLSVIAVSLHWFNPVIYIMSNAMQADCEASCDELVLAEAGGENNRFYAELIMGMIGGRKNKGTLLSTCFYGGKRGIKIRMDAIMNGTSSVGKISFSVLFAIFIALTMLSGSVFAFSVQREFIDGPLSSEVPQELLGFENGVSAVQARDIALDTVGGGMFAGLYYDEGLQIYRIEILMDNRRYYLAVGAASGDVLIYRIDDIQENYITWVQARETALSLTGGGYISFGEMFVNDNQTAFKFAVINDGIEYEIIIAATGEILAVETGD